MLPSIFLASLVLEASFVSAFPHIAEAVAASRRFDKRDPPFFTQLRVPADLSQESNPLHHFQSTLAHQVMPYITSSMPRRNLSQQAASTPGRHQAQMTFGDLAQD